MEALAAGLQFILNKIAAFFQFVLDVAVQVFKDLWEIIVDAICWPFDKALELVVTIIAEVGSMPAFATVTSGASSLQSSWPAEVANMLGLIGFWYALGIIGSALLIRFTLQLIPFTRLGS